ncbi:MAG: PEP-CTERM sorting domain-containing protein [Planctomycetota bacterium]
MLPVHVLTRPLCVVASALVLFVCLVARPAGGAQTSPAPILQWFEASWETIEHRTPDLFSAGYGSLWTPPPGRSIYLPQGGGVGYDPYDRFDLGGARDETLYGTEQGYLSAIRETQKFGGSVYVDYVHHHVGSFDLGINGYQYPQALVNQGAPFLQDRADYPGFELSDPNNPIGSPAHRDTYADLYGANAGQRPFGEVFGYWFRLGENLVTIDLASNRSFVRHPVPGEPLNTRQAPNAWAIPTTTVLPNGLVGASTVERQANVPTEANRQFYPDTDGPSRTVIDDGVAYTVYDYNLADLSQGDPVAETPRGYMMRYAQWLTQVVGVDGLRVDAARHVPLGNFNSAYNPESLDVPKLVDRAVAGASSRFNLDGTQRDVFQFQEVFNYDAGTLASFVRKNQPAGDTVNPNRDVLDFSLWAAMAQNMSGNGLQNNWFNIRSASVNATINGTSDPNIANNGENGIGFVYNHDEGVAPPGLGASIVLDNVAHAWTLMRPGQAYVYYRSNEFDRSDNNLFFLKEGRGDALGGTFGDTIPVLNDLRNSYGRGDFVERFIDNAFEAPENQQSAIYVFEREGSALVALNVGFNPGATTRTVNTTFQPGQWLEEVTGNWQDPSGEVRRYTAVDGAGQAEVDIPWNNAANGNKGYAIYGLPRPRGQMTVGGVSQVLDETPTPATNGTARITDISVVTSDSFDITVETDAVTLNDPTLGSFRDTHADGGRALVRINEGHDVNGNGVADYPSSAESNATQYGFEEFLTTNSPGFTSPTGDGLYVQTVDATQLAEGYHYVTSRVWRGPRPGESEVFIDFRETIYVDRLAPESAIASTDAFGGSSSTRDFQVESLDKTANSVHVLLNLGAGLTDAEVLSLVDPSNKSEQIDRDLFSLVESGVINGNQVATVVTYEITGNVNVQRFTGLRTVTDVGLGFGDINFDNQFDLLDIDGFGGLLGNDNTFNPAADVTGDGLIRIDDLFLLPGVLELQGADASIVDGFASLFANNTIAGDYDLDGDVDMADYDAWESQYGATGLASADGNFDGFVNAADFAIWRDAFDAVAAATVPEPATWLLAAMALVAKRRRRR